MMTLFIHPLAEVTETPNGFHFEKAKISNGLRTFEARDVDFIRKNAETATSNPMVIVSKIRFESGVEVTGMVQITTDGYVHFDEESVQVSFENRTWFIVGSSCHLSELDDDDPKF
jgi:acetyltransferase-like isoleucine patch superfamily enzyme